MSFTDQIVELAVAGQTDALRDLITAEAAQYSILSTFSMLVLDIESAHQELRSVAWDGPIDDCPEFALMDACPHPVADCYGYCCCGADLSMEVDQ